MTSKAVVVFSGGQDSTTCLYWAKERFDEVHAITFSYGQRHEIEVMAAARIARIAGVDSHSYQTIPHGFLGGISRLTDKHLKPETYKSVDNLPNGIADTFVPLRNQLFLTLAANKAYVLGAANLVTGLCQTDYSGYPDCREEFVESLERTFNLGTFTGEAGVLPITIHTPLMHLTKDKIVDLAMTYGDECYAALAWSHTAYTGGLPTDGDAASLLRARGFAEAGIPDPLVLRFHAHGEIDKGDLPLTENYNQARIEKYTPLAMKYAHLFP
jgi:7-cyano-7-deazaguanine synthase